jgi:aspartate 1-decarboxylase
MSSRIMFRSKIHRATITSSDLDYEGSITVDPELLEAADILPYEQVDVLDINSGHRFTTYTIEGERGSGEIQVNGAAARLVQKGDLCIILTYTSMNDNEARSHKPKVVLVDEQNKPVK